MTEKIRAKISGIGAYVPDYVLTNDELSRMVDTNDEWITTRVGIKERHILKIEGEGSSYMGERAVRQLFEKTGTNPDEIDLVLCATVTPDMPFPATASIIADKVGIKNAMHFDINAGCSGFIYTLITAKMYVESGQFKKVLLVTTEKMSAIVDYTDRSTCPLFGDGAAAMLIEPSNDGTGVIDFIAQSDGIGRNYLYMKAGGSCRPASAETVANREHFVYQEGRTVFKYAVTHMADVSVEVMKRNGITADTLAWLVPHQANLRIIDAVAREMNLSPEKVMINIQKYGNTTSATIPLCLHEWESRLHKGDNLILSSFGAGFTWGAIYLKWGYDGK
ncbi:MAG: ketoacyl-ACP synthase III [Salinivirgaceae bacterium]|nr:ketoacyl-ACP synthase III [Salinivirgaceae bacterium]